MAHALSVPGRDSPKNSLSAQDGPQFTGVFTYPCVPQAHSSSSRRVVRIHNRAPTAAAFTRLIFR